jgi:hypothetical protein
MAMDLGALQRRLEREAAHCTMEQLAHELQWQPGKEQDQGRFRDKALAPSTRAKLFGFVQARSPFVHILHSPGKFLSSTQRPRLQITVFVTVTKTHKILLSQ